MEYQVPQFIEVEDKIVGPLTLKQFIYLAGGAGICVVFFIYLPLIFALLAAAPVAALTLALAFYRMNGKPFISILESAFSYYTGSKLFLWKHEDRKASAQAAAPIAAAPTELPLTRGKLHDLAWSLDVKEGGSEQP